MNAITKIEARIETLETELKWLNARINGGESDYLHENEIDWDSIKSQVEDVEISSDNLIEDVKDLIETLKDLI